MAERDKLKGTKKGSVKEYQIDNLRPEIRELHYHLADKFPNDYVLTDAYRERTAKYGSSTSKHFDGEAIDIRPNEKVYNYLMNTQEGVERLNNAGIGIYDETDPRNMRVATGTHFHIGADFYDVTKSRKEQFQKYGENTPKNYYFQQQYPDFDYSDFVSERNSKKGGKYMDLGNFKDFSKDYLVKNVFSKLGPSADPSKDIYIMYSNITGESGTNYTPDQLRQKLAELPPAGVSVEHDHDHGEEESPYSVDYVSDNNPDIKEVKEQNRLLRQQMEKQQMVEEEKQRKLEEQQEIQALREKENEKLSFLESMLDRPAYVEREQSKPQQQASGGYNPNPIPQQQIDLPNIWDFGQ